MKRLIFPACVAALFHALFFLMPLPSEPVPPSASTHGTTMTVSLSVPSVQSIAAAKPEKKPEPVKEKFKKQKPLKPKREKPRPIKKKKVAKAKQKVVEPVKEVIQSPPPEVVSGPDPAPEEPVVSKETVAQVQETDAKPEETQDAESTPAVGGVQSNAKPTSVYAPEPRYPKVAIRRGYQGVVLLDILVNGDGEVKDVKVKKSSGHGVLDRSAVKGVKRWRFSSTAAVRSTWVTLPVRFELNRT